MFSVKNYLKLNNCVNKLSIEILYMFSHDELGKIYISLNKIEEAIQTFTKAVSLSPNNPIRFEK